MTLHPCFIGIDIGKDFLDVFDAADSRLLRIDNSTAAIDAFLAEPGRDTAHVVFEATGPYDGLLRKALAELGMRFSRINPARARDFARASGLLAKTDRIDARMLAELGRRLDPAPTAPASPAREALAALHRRRDQLVAMRASERVRRSEAGDPSGSISRHLRFLDAEVDDLDRQIETAMDGQDLAADASLLRSAPGVGPVTAATLLTQMPELGHRPAKAIAALAGLAPINRDSGRHRGTRHIGGGRRRVRRALYMAAVTAARRHPRFKPFYEAILARRGARKIAIIAVARKLLTILNAMMANRVAFRS